MCERTCVVAVGGGHSKYYCRLRGQNANVYSVRFSAQRLIGSTSGYLFNGDGGLCAVAARGFSGRSQVAGRRSNCIRREAGPDDGARLRSRVASRNFQDLWLVYTMPGDSREQLKDIP
jgi:hypothetical protein